MENKFAHLHVSPLLEHFRYILQALSMFNTWLTSKLPFSLAHPLSSCLPYPSITTEPNTKLHVKCFGKIYLEHGKKYKPIAYTYITLIVAYSNPDTYQIMFSSAWRTKIFSKNVPTPVLGVNREKSSKL